MTNDLVLTSTEQGITSITLNRPDKRNAMNGDMITAISKALTKAENDNSSHIVLLQGNGEHFCAGADIDWMQKVAHGSYSDNYDDAQYLADLMFQLYSFPKPTLVLAHGATLGGGLGLLSACDIALGTKEATFGFSEVKIGIVPATISPYVISAIGERAAHYYFLTGERFNGEVAHHLGLLHQVVEKEQLRAKAIALGLALQENSPQALKSAKQLIRQVSKQPITLPLVQKTAEYLANLRITAEAQEGLQAFLEKRKPTWINK